MVKFVCLVGMLLECIIQSEFKNGDRANSLQIVILVVL
jgi:hypothetical protein